MKKSVQRMMLLIAALLMPPLLQAQTTIDQFPYTYGFEVDEANGLYTLEDYGWSAINALGNDCYSWGIWSYDEASHSGDNVAWTYSSCLSHYDEVLEEDVYVSPDVFLISPAIEVNQQGLTLSFWAMNNWTDESFAPISVYIATDSTVEAFVAAGAAGTYYTTTTWQKHDIQLDAYYGQTVRIAFRHHNVTQTGDNYELWLDDISIRNTGLPVIELPTFANAIIGSPLSLSATIMGSTEGLSCSWTSANGASINANGTNATITYNTTGIDYVTLIVANNNGSDTATVRIHVSDPTPVATMPYSTGFEAGDDCNWTFVNFGQVPNAWFIGDAANYLSSRSLYTSSNAAVNNNYTYGTFDGIDPTAIAYAARGFHLEGGEYHIGYDWRCSGESQFDFMRVFLAPIDFTPDSTYNDIYRNSLPAGCIALDSGKYQQSPLDDYGLPIWAHFDGSFNVEAGYYMIVVVWQNDGNVGTGVGGAFDNLTLVPATCAAPVNLTVAQATTSSLTFTWQAGGTEGSWMVDTDSSFSHNIVVNTPSFTLDSLEPGTQHTLFVRSFCDEGIMSNRVSITGTTPSEEVTCSQPDEVYAYVYDINSDTVVIYWYNWNESPDSSMLYIDGQYIATVANSYYLHTGWNMGQTYTIGVRNICPDGSITDATTITFVYCVFPDDFGLYDITDHEASIVVKGKAGTGYNVIYYANGQEIPDTIHFVASGVKDTITFSGLTESTGYHYRLVPDCDLDNVENYSNISFNTRATYPGLTLYIGDRGYDHVSINWYATGWYANPFTSYTLKYRMQGDDEWTTVGNFDANSSYYTLTDLESGVAYELAVDGICDDNHVVTKTLFVPTSACEEAFGGVYESSNAIPFATNFSYTYNQSMLTADELDRMGDVISGITYISDATTPADYTRTIDVYIGETDAYDLTASLPFENLTLVADDYVVTPDAGLVNIPFDQSYTRNHDNNLVIAIYDHTGSVTTENNNMLHWLGSYDYSRNWSRVHYASYESALADIQTTIDNFRPYIRLDVDECSLPDNCEQPYISLANQDANGYTFSFGPAQPNIAYNVSMRTDYYGEWVTLATDVTSGQYTLTEQLTYNHTYYIKVWRLCGPDSTLLESTYNFHANCYAPYMNVEYVDDGIMVSWDGMEGESYELAYHIQFSDDEYTIVDLDEGATSYTFRNLNGDRQYEFRLGKMCSNGMTYNSSYYNYGTCMAPEATISGSTATSVTFTWEADPNTTTYYILYNDIIEEVDATLLTYTVEGLQPGSAYTFNIGRACASGIVWGDELYVFTMCEPLDVPFYEDFENMPYYGALNATCWNAGTFNDNPDISHTNYPYTVHLTYSNDAMLCLNGGAYAVLPQFSAPLNELQLRAEYYCANPDGYFVIGLTNGEDVSFFESIDTIRRGDYSDDNDAIVTYVFDNIDEAYNNHRIVLYAPIDTTLVGVSYNLFRSLTVEEVPLCGEVANVSVSQIGTDNATVTWDTTEDNPIEYIVEYGPEGFQPGNGYQISATSNSITLTDLYPGTSYQVYVTVNCGRKGLSHTSAPATFATGCAPIEAPYYESFYSCNVVGSNFTNMLPNCWAYDPAATDSGAYITPQVYLYDGGRILLIYDTTIVAMSEMVDPINTLHIEMGIDYIESDWALVLGAVTGDGYGFGATFEPIDTITEAGTYSRFLDSYAGTNSRLALKNVFIGEESADTYTAAGEIDITYVSVERIPNCMAPLDVVATATDAHTVVVDWTDYQPASQWHIYYYDGTWGWNERDTVVSSHPVTFTGLYANLYYSFYVQTVCGDEQSDWSDPAEITTPNNCDMDINVHVVSYNDDGSVTIGWNEYGDSWIGLYDNEKGYWYEFDENPATIYGLERGDAYNFEVYYHCYNEYDEGYSDAVAGTFAVNVPCEVHTVSLDEDFFENFEGSTLCWNYEQTSEGGFFDYMNGDGWGLYELTAPVFGSTDEHLAAGKLYSPNFILEDSTALSFWYKNSQNDSVTFTYTLYLADGSTVTSQPITASDGEWHEWNDSISEDVVRISFDYADNSDAPAYRLLHIDDVWLHTLEREGCYQPDTYLMSELGATTATFTIGMSYDSDPHTYDVRLVSYADESVMTATTDETGTVTFTGLTSGVTYQVDARTICGDGYSYRTYHIGEFTTGCAGPIEAPYYASFANSGLMPTCWAYDPTSLSLNDDDTPYCDYNELFVPGNVTFAMPEMVNPINTLMLGVEVYPSSYSDNISAETPLLIEVGVVDNIDDGFAASFEPVDTIVLTENNSYHSATIYFNNYTGNGNRIALRQVMPEGTDYAYCWYNYMYIEEMPTCVAPQNLHVVSVDANSVTLDWDDVTTAENWVVYYWDGNEDHEDTVTMHPVTIAGLSAATNYGFDVLSICSDDDVSYWSDWIEATTDCGPVNVPYYAYFGNEGVLPNCWAYDPASLSENYDYVPQNMNGYFYLIGNATVAMPEMADPINTLTLQMEYYTHVEYLYTEAYNNAQTIIEVGVVSGADSGFASTFVPVDTIVVENLGNYFVNYQLQLADYAGNGNRIALRQSVTGGETMTYTFFNSISIFQAPNCFAPANVTVAANDDDVTVEWTQQGSSVGHDIVLYGHEYRYYEDVTSPYTITDLTPGMDYSLQVLNRCDDDNYIGCEWVEFTADCHAYTELPLYYDFEDVAVGELPTCWAYDPLYTSLDEDNALAGAPQVNYFSTAAGRSLNIDYTSIVALPEVAAPINTLTVDFDILEVGTGAGEGTLTIGVVDNAEPGFEASFVAVENINYSTGHYSVSLAAYEGNGNRIAFSTSTPTDEWYYLSLDNIEVNGTMEPCESTVSDLTASNVTATTVDLSWSNTQNDYHFVVYGPAGWTVDDEDDLMVEDAGFDTSLTLTGLEPATTYDARIATICGEYGIALSEPVTFTTLEYVYEECEIPTNVTVSDITESSATVSWNAIEGVQGYLVAIYGDEYGDFAFTEGTSHTFAGLTAQSEYTVSVITVCDSNEYAFSEWSDEVDFTTLESVYVECEAPTNVVVSNVTETSATFGWDAVEGAQVYVAAVIDNDFTEYSVVDSAIAETNSVTFGSLTAGTDYMFLVVTVCDSTEGYFSNLSTVAFTTLPADTVPECVTPTAIAFVSNDTNSIQVTWEATEGTSYVVAWMEGDDASDWDNGIDGVNVGEANVFACFPLEPGTSYVIGVRAECADEWTLGVFSTDTVPYIPEPTCDTPTGLAVSNVTSSTAYVSWNAVEGAYDYNVSYTSAAGTVTISTQETHISLTGLTASTAYTVRVQTGCDPAAGLYSDWSEAVGFTTLANEGIDDVASAATIDIYPNPASTTATVMVEGVSGRVSVAVVDVNGRTLQTLEVEGGQPATVDVSRLSQGAYFVRIVGDGSSVVRKLIVR